MQVMASIDTSHKEILNEPLRRIVEARHHDPFEVLGCHRNKDQAYIWVFLPRASKVRIEELDAHLKRIPGSDLFLWQGLAADVPERYQIAWTDKSGQCRTGFDPYCFPPQLEDFDSAPLW